MKRLLFLAFSLLLISSGFATPKYWVGGASGTWTATSSWSVSSGGASGAAVPVKTDDVIFDGNSGAGPYNVIGIVSQTINTLTVSGTNTIVNLQSISVAQQALNIANGNVSGYDLTVAAGCQLNLDGGVNGYQLAIILYKEATADIFGSMSFQNTGFVGPFLGNSTSGCQVFNATGYTGASITFESGASAISQSTLPFGNSSADLNFTNNAVNDFSRVIFKSGSSYYNKGGNHIMGGSTGIVQSVQFQTGSTYYHQSPYTNGFNVPLIPTSPNTRTFADFVYDSPARLIGGSGGNINLVFDNFIIKQGSLVSLNFNAKSGAAQNITFNKNIYIADGDTLLLSGGTAVACHVNMAGVSRQEISCGKYGTNNTGSLQLGNNTNLIINNSSTPAVTLKNILNLNNVTSTVTSTSGLLDASTCPTATLKISASSTYIFSSTSAFKSNIFSNLIIANNATLSTPINVSGALTLTNGAFTHNANLTMGKGATIIQTKGTLFTEPLTK